MGCKSPKMLLLKAGAKMQAISTGFIFIKACQRLGVFLRSNLKALHKVTCFNQGHLY